MEVLLDVVEVACITELEAAQTVESAKGGDPGNSSKGRFDPVLSPWGFSRLTLRANY